MSAQSNSNVEVVEGLQNIWVDVNCNHILKILRQLPDQYRPNDKRFYSTYPTEWASLETNQKKKVIDYYDSLNGEGKIYVKECFENGDDFDESTKSPNTSKHERVRVLQIMADPSLLHLRRRA